MMATLLLSPEKAREAAELFGMEYLADNPPRLLPITFHDRTVKAILDRSKTQTRRVMVPQPIEPDMMPVWREGEPTWRGVGADVTTVFNCPFGRPGDLLYVREACSIKVAPKGLGDPFASIVRYRADGTELTITIPDDITVKFDNERGWRPSIHMPKWTSRIVLFVTGVWPERLQSINDDDVMAEGVRIYDPEWSPQTNMEASWDTMFHDTAKAWKENPVVWVIEFSVVQVRGAGPFTWIWEGGL